MSCIKIRSFSLPEKCLRTAVFQHGEHGTLFERLLIRIYKFFTQRICSAGYDFQRAKKGLDTLERLGAQLQFIPINGAKIHTLLLRPQDLKEKLNQVGARWEKTTLRTGEEVLAIIPPTVPTERWHMLERDLLRFKWQKREGVIVTCSLSNRKEERLFIHANSASVSFVMLFERIGFYLGSQAAVCCFDPPGSGLSSGIAFEGSYYETIKSVFTRFSSGYSHDHIWVTGACLGCVSAAYLKSQFPDVNLLLENGFSDMKKDMVGKQTAFVKWFANRFWKALLRGDPSEVDFSIVRLWAKMQKSNRGKVIVVSVENDQFISAKVTRKLIEAAKGISERVAHIAYRSPNTKDPHFDRFYRYRSVVPRVLAEIYPSRPDIAVCI